MKDEKKATRQSYGEALLELGKENKNIVVLDADLSTATKTCLFAKEFQDRFKAELSNDLNTANSITVLYDLIKDDTVNGTTKRYAQILVSGFSCLTFSIKAILYFLFRLVASKITSSYLSRESIISL